MLLIMHAKDALWKLLFFLKKLPTIFTISMRYLKKSTTLYYKLTNFSHEFLKLRIKRFKTKSKHKKIRLTDIVFLKNIAIA